MRRDLRGFIEYQVQLASGLAQRSNHHHNRDKANRLFARYLDSNRADSLTTRDHE